MLRWMLTPTQQGKADALGYVPLPENLRQKHLLLLTPQMKKVKENLLIGFMMELIEVKLTSQNVKVYMS